MSGSNGINGVGGPSGVNGAGQSGGNNLVGEGKGLVEGVVRGVTGLVDKVGRGGQGNQGNQVEGGQRGQQGVTPHGRGQDGPNNTRQGGRVDHSDGPGRSGHGNAYGHYKHDNDRGDFRGHRGGDGDDGNWRGRGRGGDDHGRPAQLLADEPRVSQLRHRIETQQQRSGRDDGQFDGGRTRDYGRDNRPGHANDGRHDSPRFDSPGRDNHLRPRDLPSSIESFTRAATEYARSGADGATSLLFRVGGGRGGGHDYGFGSSRLNDAAVSYLRGLSDGADLPPSTRALLDSVKQALGPSAVTALSDRETGKVLRLVERALDHMGRSVEHALRRGDDFVRMHGHATAPLERFTSAGTHSASPDHVVRELADELLGAALLGRYLKRLEGTGGGVVRQAEEMIARLLYGSGGADGRPQPTPAPEPRLHPQEFLRDLREGVFVPRQEQFNPFPLTGRARVVAEMMELMRTLDAVEGALRQATAQAGAQVSTESHVAAWLKAHLAGTLGATLDELLALLAPTLPGRAARYEIPRAVAAMNGLLTDADGRALLARDGTPLKLERLVWLSAAGGLLGGSALGSAFAADSFPTRLSPLLVYGFDAIYSVIGFDGRTLASPHFVSVQAAVNDSESEWVFGQQPLSAGWVCALIERLKDSALVEYNLLGEMLEEAWADGRFHVAVLNVAVEEGETVPDSSAVTHLLPGASGELAFA